MINATQQVILKDINDEDLQWCTTNCLNDYFIYCLVESVYYNLSNDLIHRHIFHFIIALKIVLFNFYETDFEEQKIGALPVPYTDNIPAKIKGSQSDLNIIKWKIS